MLSEIRKGRDIAGYRATMLKVNEEVVKRLTSKLRGVLNKFIPMARDFKNAYQNTSPGQPIPRDVLNTLGLEIGENGMLYVTEEVGEGRILEKIGGEVGGKVGGQKSRSSIGQIFFRPGLENLPISES